MRHETEDSLDSMGRLVGGIAHSFNNLLAAIGFHTDLLLDEAGLGPAARAHAEEIQRAGERAASFCRQLLAFGGKQVLQPHNLSLNEVLADLVPRLRRLVGEQIRLETALDPLAGTIFADQPQLEQVIVNLVLNARDAMPKGGRLRIATALNEGADKAESEVAARPRTELTVSDEGMGIPPEVRSRLFEPFFTTKGHAGMGLATVYGIVRQSGGDVAVASEPGCGAAFTVTLPRVGGDEAVPRQAAPAARPGQDGSEVVLLVEDEDNIREPMAAILESRGYTVLPACGGTEALALAARFPGAIHLLITDIVMPGMNGGLLAEELRQRRPETRVLFFSGYPEETIAHQGVLDESKAFLQKPSPSSVLLQKMREILDLPA